MCSRERRIAKGELELRFESGSGNVLKQRTGRKRGKVRKFKRGFVSDGKRQRR